MRMDSFAAVIRKPRQSASRIEAGCARRQGITAPHGAFFATSQSAETSSSAKLAYAFLMRCFLGFDGGGTKTECLLMDESGKILARSRSGPSNPFRIGVAAAAQALQQAADHALREAGALPADVQAVCAGLAGTARPENSQKMRAALLTAFPQAAVRVLTDLELALATMVPGPAIVLVAGTGSAVIGRDASGNIARVGGYGPAGSDEGSAYDVGRAAIAVSAREREARGEETALGRQILRQLGCANWEDVFERARANADAVFPRVFPVVAAAADAGDTMAQGLLFEAARKLSLLVSTLVQKLGLEASPFALGKTGGMIGRSSFFDATLDRQLLLSAPSANLTQLPLPPAEAAAHLALDLARTAPGTDL
jgi:N-acetylglucosamine kinase-like BadF-type ATPase